MLFIKKNWFAICIFIAVAVLLWLEMDNIKNWLGIATEGDPVKPPPAKPAEPGNQGTKPPPKKKDYSTHPTYSNLVDKEKILYNGVKNAKPEVERLQVYLAVDQQLDEKQIDGIFGQKTADALYSQKKVYSISLKDYEK